MPHTTRRRPPSPPTKTKLTTTSSSDGWTTVVRRGNDGNSSSSRTRSTVDVDTLTQRFQHTELSVGEGGRGQGEVPQPRSARYTEEELRKQFHRVRALWAASRARSVMTGMVDRGQAMGSWGEVVNAKDHGHGRADGRGAKEKLSGCPEGREGESLSRDTEAVEEEYRWRIDRAVCLGLGSPSVDTTGWRMAVMWQLVVLIDLIEMLTLLSSLEPAQAIPIYISDPVLNTTDISFLTNLSCHLAATSKSSAEQAYRFTITVLPYPLAEPLITCDTLLYLPHFPHALWPTQLRTPSHSNHAPQVHEPRTIPAVVIGNTVGEGIVIEDGASVSTQEISEEQKDKESSTVDGQDQSRQWTGDAKLAFLSYYEGLGFPEPEETEHVFNDTTVYWPREKE